MSNKESQFIRWLAGITGTLIVALIISMLQFHNTTSQKEAADEQKFRYIERDIKEIKVNIKEINYKIDK